MRASILIAAALFSSLVSAQIISIKTIEGDHVQVYKKDIDAIYNKTGDRKTGERKQYVTWDNDDGTITIEAPRYRHRGKLLAFADLGYPSENKRHADLICKFLGYGKANVYTRRYCNSNDYPAKNVAGSEGKNLCFAAQIENGNGPKGITFSALVGKEIVFESVTCFKNRF